MSRKRTSRVGASLAALVVASAAYLAAPGAPRAQSAEDSNCTLENVGPVCSMKWKCVRVWWFSLVCGWEVERLPVLPV